MLHYEFIWGNYRKIYCQRCFLDVLYSTYKTFKIQTTEDNSFELIKNWFILCDRRSIYTIFSNLMLLPNNFISLFHILFWKFAEGSHKSFTIITFLKNDRTTFVTFFLFCTPSKVLAVRTEQASLRNRQRVVECCCFSFSPLQGLFLQAVPTDTMLSNDSNLYKH